MSSTDTHPWTPLRHLVEALFQQMLKDFPNADINYLFTESLLDCEDAWNTIMTQEQKNTYIKLAEEDSDKSAHGSAYDQSGMWFYANANNKKDFIMTLEMNSNPLKQQYVSICVCLFPTSPKPLVLMS